MLPVSRQLNGRQAKPVDDLLTNERSAGSVLQATFVGEEKAWACPELDR